MRHSAQQMEKHQKIIGNHKWMRDIEMIMAQLTKS